jgi:hypothetical protein
MTTVLCVPRNNREWGKLDMGDNQEENLNPIVRVRATPNSKSHRAALLNINMIVKEYANLEDGTQEDLVCPAPHLSLSFL